MTEDDVELEERIWAIVVARRREVPHGFRLTALICPGCYEAVDHHKPNRTAPNGKQLWHVGCFYEIGKPEWEAEAKRWGYRHA
jgi:hypothetical protein